MELRVTTASDEAFLLDLLNTTPVVDGVPTDALPDLATSADWLAAHGVPVRTQEWAALVEARAALQAVVRGDASPAVGSPEFDCTGQALAGPGGRLE